MKNNLERLEKGQIVYPADGYEIADLMQYDIDEDTYGIVVAVDGKHDVYSVDWYDGNTCVNQNIETRNYYFEELTTNQKEYISNYKEQEDYKNKEFEESDGKE